MRRAFLHCSTGLLTVLALLTPRIGAQEPRQAMSPAMATQSVEFNVFLPLQHTEELDRLLEEQNTPGSAIFHKWLTPAEFQSRFGANPEDIATVSETLKYYGFTVVQTHSHGVQVRGNVAAVEHTFGTSLSNAVTARGTTRIKANQPLTLPTALERMGAQIVHFASLPPLRPQAHRVATSISPENRYSRFGPYWFNDLKQAYDFPSKLALDGRGRTIAVMEASDFLDSDIAKYFAHESKPHAPISPPNIIRFPIHGGSPFDPNSGLSFECELDLQQAGGMAPGATLVLVNLPDASDGSFIDGYLTLVELNFVDIVSTSFGSPEAFYTAPFNHGVDMTGILRVFDELFKQGNAQGMTFVNSSGDMGGLAAPPVAYVTTPPSKPPKVVGRFQPGVSSFADDPHVTGIGGTNLETTFDPPSLESRYVSENAFPDPEVPYDPFGLGNLIAGGVWGSGGGKSIVFAKPPYQHFIETHSSTRAVPDISLQMGGCPAGIAKLPCHPTDSAAVEVFNGKLVGVIGTSIGAPDFAGILALREQYLGGSRLGNVNFEIYTTAAAQPSVANTPFEFFHQGQPGNNGAFSTTPHGYNLVLGVGTPLVRNFIFAPFLPPAGNPQTPSNP